MKKLTLLAMLLIPGLAFSQGVYPYLIGTDYRQGSYNGGKNSAAIEKMQGDLALAEISYASGQRKGIIVLDAGDWAITNSVTFLNYAQYIVPLGSTITVHTNKILNLNGATFWAENFPVFMGSGTVTGCMNVAISHDDGQWGGMWTNFFTGNYYATNCAGLIGGDDIAKDSITGDHVIDESFCGDDIGDGCITTRHYEDGSVCSNAIGPGCIHSNHLGGDVASYINTFVASTNATVLFRVSKSDAGGAQSMPNRLQLYKTTFDTINADVDSYGSGGWDTNNQCFKAPVNGWYRFYAKLNGHKDNGERLAQKDDYTMMIMTTNGGLMYSMSQRIEAGSASADGYESIGPVMYDEFYLASNDCVSLFVYPDMNELSIDPEAEEVPIGRTAMAINFFGGGLVALTDPSSTNSSSGIPFDTNTVSSATVSEANVAFTNDTLYFRAALATNQVVAGAGSLRVAAERLIWENNPYSIGGYNTTNQTFTAPTNGYYIFKAQAYGSGAGTNGAGLSLMITGTAGTPVLARSPNGPWTAGGSPISGPHLDDEIFLTNNQAVVLWLVNADLFTTTLNTNVAAYPHEINAGDTFWTGRMIAK